MLTIFYIFIFKNIAIFAIFKFSYLKTKEEKLQKFFEFSPKVNN